MACPCCLWFCYSPTAGACCEADGACSIKQECECQGETQEFQGIGTACDPDPCCEEPEGDCCLSERFTQATLEIAGVAQAGVNDTACLCANTVRVIDLFGGPVVAEVVPCNSGYAFPIQVELSVNVPIRCEEVYVLENGNFIAVPGVWGFRAGDVSFAMQVAFKRQDLVTPQPGVFPSTFLAISLTSGGETIYGRQLCSDSRRPVASCSDALAALPASLPAQVDRSFSAECDISQATGSITFQ